MNRTGTATVNRTGTAGTRKNGFPYKICVTLSVRYSVGPHFIWWAPRGRTKRDSISVQDSDSGFHCRHGSGIPLPVRERELAHALGARFGARSFRGRTLFSIPIRVAHARRPRHVDYPAISSSRLTVGSAGISNPSRGYPTSPRWPIGRPTSLVSEFNAATLSLC